MSEYINNNSQNNGPSANASSWNAEGQSSGHPIEIFKQENNELRKEVASLESVFSQVRFLTANTLVKPVFAIRATFNNIMDVEKHYQKKEQLIGPLLERYAKSELVKEMIAKHNEVRGLLKTVIDTFKNTEIKEPSALASLIENVIRPALKALDNMMLEEESQLYPLCMNTFSEKEWYDIYVHIPEIGYCLYDPQIEWRPEGVVHVPLIRTTTTGIMLSTGSFKVEDLEAIFSILPIDLTFVDKDDKVKFYSNSPERVFPRTRAVLGRDVRLCHPPGSVHVVEQILSDFKSGKESTAAFWINFHERFLYIEYFAVRDKEGNYLGTVEFTQDATKVRSLEGEQRILSYTDKK